MDTAAEYDFQIDSQQVCDLVSAYLESESYRSAVSAYEAEFDTKTSGCLLDKAVEYHQKDLDGFQTDAVILNLRTNVFYGDGVSADNVQVYYDLNTATFYDSVTIDIDAYTNTFDSVCRSEEEVRAILMSALYGMEGTASVFYSSQGASRFLTAQEVASVNETLDLSYRGYESAEEAEDSVDPETGAPIITTDADARLQSVIAMAEAFRETPIWRQIAYDPTALRVTAAMEYKNDNFASGIPVHILMIHTDDFNADMYENIRGTMLMDMESGQMYTASDFDFNDLTDIHSFTSAEDAYPYCMMTYDNILDGSETQLWASVGETIVHLTEEELEFVNETLDAAEAQVQAERETAQMQAAEDLNDLQRTAFHAAVAFGKTARYREAAFDPAVIRLSAASELRFVHPDNGFALHALLLTAENVDTDMYGIDAGTFLMDLNTGAGFTDITADLSNWTWDWADYSDPVNAYAAALLQYEQIRNGIATFAFMDHENCETWLHLSPADLDAVNAALNP